MSARIHTRPGTPMHLRRFAAIVGVCALTLSACNDLPTAPSGDEGQITFRFAGASAGSLRLSGPGFTSPDDHPYVDAEAVTEHVASITAYRYLRPRYSDLLVLTVPRARGTYPVSCYFAGEPCINVRGGVTTEFPSQAGEQLEFRLETGTITVTGAEKGRLRGTFSGRGPATRGGKSIGTLEVSEGTFDVPM